MKKWMKIGVAVLVVVLLLGAVAPVQADELDDLYAQLERLRQEKEALQKEAKNTKRRIENLGEELEVLEEILTETRYTLDKLNRQIEKHVAMITQQETDIAAKEQEIAETEAFLEDQLGHLEQRMRVMYKNGAVSYMEVLFAASSFSDFLSRLNFLAIIITSDSDLVKEVRETREWLNQEKLELDQELVLLVDRRTKLEIDRGNAQVKETEVQGLVAAKDAATKELQKQLASQQVAIGALQKQADEFNELIAAALQEQYYEGKAPTVYVWPVPVTRYVSSPYGWRTIWGQPNWHRGIDIAPSHIYWKPSPRYEGTPAYVVAAAAGKVVKAEYNPSYGWFALIQHGGGYATLYAHLHERPAVSVGQTVVPGQRVGIVGSTGQSTGPHLHFEIRLNTKTTNPLDYPYID